MESQIPVPPIDTTDYADMVAYISGLAESLELETAYGPGGNHAVTEATHKASLLLRRAEAILRPLAEAISNDHGEITAADPE
jgi:hypothetical protein